MCQNLIVKDSSMKREYFMQTMNKEQFSPVGKLSSAKPIQGRNLTGSARHIRDLAADVHANIQQWNSLHLEGIMILKDISEEKQNESYSEELQTLCDKLEVVCNSLDDVVCSLAEITRQIKIIATLEKSADKLFTTWQSAKFGEVTESLYNAYSIEAKIKQKVLENVAHYSTESWRMLYLATWVHQPLLPEHLTTYLESLLIETGHR